MSFFKKLWWCGGNDVGPEKEFTIVLGNKKENKNNINKGRYGTSSERMTSPGRVAMREYIGTPESKDSKATLKTSDELKGAKPRGFENHEEEKKNNRLVFKSIYKNYHNKNINRSLNKLAIAAVTDLTKK